jgi:uncharacterized protein with HEPN domain
MSPDQGFLEDMLHEARTALEFVDGFTEDEFLRDRRTQHAVLRCLEIIGEAASRVSPEGRARFASLPWSDIIGQRHIAIHHYGKVKMPRIWATVRDDVPALVTALAQHLEANP